MRAQSFWFFEIISYYLNHAKTIHTLFGIIIFTIIFILRKIIFTIIYCTPYFKIWFELYQYYHTNYIHYADYVWYKRHTLTLLWCIVLAVVLGDEEFCDPTDLDDHPGAGTDHNYVVILVTWANTITVLL